MDMEGARWGMFVASLLMITVPTCLLVAFGVFYVRELRRERGREPPEEEGSGRRGEESPLKGRRSD